jgi:osmotically-inducible protein OsmY
MNRLATFSNVEAHLPRGSRQSDKKSHWNFETPHRLEQAVQRHLLSHPDLRFSTLVIRRIPNGVCLEGVLEDAADHDVCGLARSVSGVNEVLNHLVVRQKCTSDRATNS